ncbi:MAG: hypothetical protein L0I76_04835 [Pseudonocardia sp.]|nr:hypothetical protein [Pseudonocardia sp.]
MTEPPDIEARVTALEVRMEQAASDAAAARHLAAARDRDLADLTVKVDVNRSAINALGVQTAARFDRLEARVESGFAQVDRRFAQIDQRFAQIDRQFEQVDRNFAEIRGRLDQTAAGQQQITDMLTTLIERQDGR